MLPGGSFACPLDFPARRTIKSALSGPEFDSPEKMRNKGPKGFPGQVFSNKGVTCGLEWERGNPTPTVRPVQSLHECA